MPMSNSRKILLVEDEVLIALSEKLSLEKYGYIVITANTGEAAILLCLNEGGIDLVLMDIDLGKGIDGTVAAGIILREREVPVIFLSSHTDAEMVDKTEAITNYGYVVKSSSITVLDASIKMAFKLFDANRRVDQRNAACSEAQQSLSDSEERYRRLFETAQDGIIILDAETGMIQDVNPFMIELLGYSRDQLLQKHIWEIGFLHDVIASKDNFQELKNEGYVRYENLPLETASGLKLDVEFISNAYTVKNYRVIQCNIREISARMHKNEVLLASEIRFRRLFETTGTGILILDGESGRILDVNPYLIDLLGYSKDQFVEKALWEIGLFKDVADSKDTFKRIRENEVTIYENLPLETSLGATINVKFVCNAYDIEDKKIIQCNIQDISERFAAAKSLEAIARDKQNLLKELQHRVKNSFNLITILISMAGDKENSIAFKASMDELADRVRSVSELYSLLYLSDSFTEIRLDEYCLSVADGIAGLSSRISHTNEMEAITISAKNAIPIGLILTELITNAMKYAFPDGRNGCVAISLKHKEGGAVLCVEDDGCGLGSAFDISKSLGCGLNLITGLASQLDGNFTIESRGRGTSCRLEFPLT
jgi:PAS domain S-box-containing protein